MESFEIFFDEDRGQWEIWFYHNNKEITIHSDSTWKCREDVEQDTFNRMLDGKI